MELNRQKVLVTGAATGMGLEATRRFARGGAHVIMVARDSERLTQAAAELDGATVFAAELSREDDLIALAEYVESQHPDLDLVFLNAGITHTYRLFTGEDSRALADAEMRTNYLSAVTLIPRLVPVLERNPDPILVMTTSAVVFGPDIMNPTYSATKAALHSLTLSARLQLERDESPVRIVEFLAPLVDSPFSAAVTSTEKMSPAEAIDRLFEGLHSSAHELRVGAAEDVFRALGRSSDDAVRLVNDLTGG